MKQATRNAVFPLETIRLVGLTVVENDFVRCCLYKTYKKDPVILAPSTNLGQKMAAAVDEPDASMPLDNFSRAKDEKLASISWYATSVA